MSIDNKDLAKAHFGGWQRGYGSVMPDRCIPVNGQTMLDFMRLNIESKGRAKFRAHVIQTQHKLVGAELGAAPLAHEFLDGFAEGVLAHYDQALRDRKNQVRCQALDDPDTGCVRPATHTLYKERVPMCSEHLQRVKDEDVLSLDELATIHLIATTSSHETFDPHATRKLLSFLEEISVMHAQDPRFTTIVLTASKKRELHQLWAAVRDSERKPPTIDGALADEAVSRWVAAAALPRVSPDAAEANDRKKPWRLVGYDTFDGEAYFLSGYDSEDACRRAASERLAELEREQPSDISGGQDGIQDWVFIVTPAGTYDRYLRTLGE